MLYDTTVLEPFPKHLNIQPNLDSWNPNESHDDQGLRTHEISVNLKVLTTPQEVKLPELIHQQIDWSDCTELNNATKREYKDLICVCKCTPSLRADQAFRVRDETSSRTSSTSSCLRVAFRLTTQREVFLSQMTLQEPEPRNVHFRWNTANYN